MKRRSLAVGIFLLAFPAQVLAQQSMFQLFYDEGESSLSRKNPSDGLKQFIIDEMEDWQSDGIELTMDDIDAAIDDKLWLPDNTGLCQDKVDMNGEDIVFLQGGENAGASCIGLQEDIISLLDAEREANELGSDLLAAANGSELSVADEPHRPVDMASFALGLRRVWAGTGAAVIPWDGTAEDEFDTLDTNLQALDPEELEKAILRFHFGYYRDQREADPRFDDIADDIGDDLRAIADKLGVADTPTGVGVFAIPDLDTPNVGLWARADDIGLMWIYPSKFTRLSYKEADRYPVLKPGSDRLAYPYSYEGDGVAAGAGIDSPLCSRTVGRNGYLCRPLPEAAENCNVGSTSAITLKDCSGTTSGPMTVSICPDFNKLFLDDDTPITDPNNPGALNPALKPADTSALCTPETKTLYQDDIASHACYVGFCLRQSFGSGHTLIANRSPAVINETTSPYLACIRPDPQLGLYTEVAEDSPYPLPEYLGHFLVRDFDRQYCVVNGSAPQPLAGLCASDSKDDAPSVRALGVAGQHAGLEEERSLIERQRIHEVVAEQAGYRAALDQSIELQRKVFAKLASVVQQTASLFLELKNAPLTQSACPWTGPFKSSSAPSS